MQTKPLVDTSIEVLKKLPPDSRMEDIMYELNLTDQVIRGLDDAKEGRVITTEELLERMKKRGLKNTHIPISSSKPMND